MLLAYDEDVIREIVEFTKDQFIKNFHNYRDKYLIYKVVHYKAYNLYDAYTIIFVDKSSWLGFRIETSYFDRDKVYSRRRHFITIHNESLKAYDVRLLRFLGYRIEYPRDLGSISEVKERIRYVVDRIFIFDLEPFINYYRRLLNEIFARFKWFKNLYSEIGEYLYNNGVRFLIKVDATVSEFSGLTVQFDNSLELNIYRTINGKYNISVTLKHNTFLDEVDGNIIKTFVDTCLSIRDLVKIIDNVLKG